MDIGSKLKALRKDKNMTQAKLAKRAGLHESMIAKMEIGIREISAIELAKIARILDVNMNSFFYRTSVFDGKIEEAIIESMGLLPESKKKRVIGILKVDLYSRSKKAKGEFKKKIKELKRTLNDIKFEE